MKEDKVNEKVAHSIWEETHLSQGRTEPKPDEGRLLSPFKIKDMVREQFSDPIIRGIIITLCKKVARAQDTKTASYLVELDPNQELPKQVSSLGEPDWYDIGYEDGYIEAQQDMIKASFKKVKEESK